MDVGPICQIFINTVPDPCLLYVFLTLPLLFKGGDVQGVREIPYALPGGIETAWQAAEKEQKVRGLPLGMSLRESIHVTYQPHLPSH